MGDPRVVVLLLLVRWAHADPCGATGAEHDGRGARFEGLECLLERGTIVSVRIVGEVALRGTRKPWVPVG